MTNQKAIKILQGIDRLIGDDFYSDTIDEAVEMAIDALKCKPTVIRCEKLLSKEDFEAVIRRIHEENQNVIVIPYEAEDISTNTPTKSSNTPTKSTDISTDTSTEPTTKAPRPIEPTITVDLESGVVPISACEPKAPKTIVYIDRRKGKWIDIPYVPSHTKYMCSECGNTIYTNSDYIKEHKFCFSCGSHMLGGESK